MPRSNDKTGAALLVAAVVLLAGSFAGFSFGTTGRDLRSANQATPLLLQSAATVTQAEPCTESGSRNTRPVFSAERAPAPPAPRATPAPPRARPIST